MRLMYTSLPWMLATATSDGTVTHFTTTVITTTTDATTAIASADLGTTWDVTSADGF